MTNTTPGRSEGATAQRFFLAVTAWRWPVLLLCMGLITASGAFLPTLSKDTSADAFIEASHPALVDRDRVERIFGLSDPIVVALVAEQAENGIFEPGTLSLVRELTESIRRLDNVDPERVTSLATEKNIEGTPDGMLVEEFLSEEGTLFKAPVGSPDRARAIASALKRLPLYQGSLVARDGSATLVVAELLHPERSEETYDAINELIGDAVMPAGIEVVVAGEGAIAGQLSKYIDKDAARLNPLAVVIISVVLLLAYFSLRAVVLPNLIVLATVAASLGMMAASGVSFFVITNGLIVNLIGIAVADSIHVFGQYAEEVRHNPAGERRQLVVAAMSRIWRPITLTTMTTMAGFLALGAAAEMPPVRYFGIFGAVGVAAAWVYSMTLLPAAMVLWPMKGDRATGRKSESGTASGLSARAMIRIGAIVLQRPRTILAMFTAVVLGGLVGAFQVTVNDSTIENFKPDEPLYQADKTINRVMDGTYYLDVMVEAEESQGLLSPAYLKRMEALQTFLLTLPHVNGATSVVDYVKLMNRAVNENQQAAYRIPEDRNLIAQLFLLYKASADPTDFEEEIDSDYRRALVRARVDRSTYQNNRELVPAVDRYLEGSFNGDGIRGHVTGSINVDYHWIDAINRNHAMSVGLAFSAVLLAAMIVFRSVVGGFIAVLPVAMAILLVYAVMGYGEIWLGVGTSMFAAIGIGLGVDFAIHALHRLREAVRREGFSDDALLSLYPDTGRALAFNFLAVLLGFGVLTTSEVPPLVRFGALVGVAVTASFLCAVTVLPALVKLLQPAFMKKGREQ